MLKCNSKVNFHLPNLICCHKQTLQITEFIIYLVYLKLSCMFGLLDSFWGVVTHMFQGKASAEKKMTGMQ